MFRICFLIAALLSTPALADFSGAVQVIDGDTIDVGDIRVRIHGIDAPEMDQTCDYQRGGVWACGAFVAQEAARRYQGQQARCEEIDRDRYGRIVAKCFVGGTDIGAALVEDGFAYAYRRYSMDYDLAEKAAAVRGVGLWSGGMQDPAAFRAQQRPTPTAAPSGGCIIKGNISSSGRIYHMPHNENYEDTRINEARGERWFCSEEEARNAGWRAARN